MKSLTTLIRRALPVAGLALLMTACSPDSQTSSAGQTSGSGDIKGEPIQPLTAATGIKGEPIQPLAQAEPAAPVATNSVAAVAPDAPPNDGIQREPNFEVPPPPPTFIKSGDVDYLSVGFDQLASYTFEVTDELLEAKGDPAELTAKTNQQIPETIRKLSDQPVAVKGYMLPLKVEQGAVTEFLLMRDQSMCCFGTVPKINEWVSVKTIGKGVKPVMDEPVTIFGKLHVGEMRENGYLVGIYRMDGEKLAGPLDL